MPIETMENNVALLSTGFLLALDNVFNNSENQEKGKVKFNAVINIHEIYSVEVCSTIWLKDMQYSNIGTTIVPVWKFVYFSTIFSMEFKVRPNSVSSTFVFVIGGVPVASTILSIIIVFLYIMMSDINHGIIHYPSFSVRLSFFVFSNHSSKTESSQVKYPPLNFLREINDGFVCSGG